MVGVKGWGLGMVKVSGGDGEGQRVVGSMGGKGLGWG